MNVDTVRSGPIGPGSPSIPGGPAGPVGPVGPFPKQHICMPRFPEQSWYTGSSTSNMGLLTTGDGSSTSNTISSFDNNGDSCMTTGRPFSILYITR